MAYTTHTHIAISIDKYIDVVASGVKQLSTVDAPDIEYVFYN